MSAKVYNVNSTAPIPIYPQGQQGTLTVYNSGTATTVFLSDMPSTLTGFPLAPGDSITWDSGKALYSWVNSDSSTLVVLDNGGTITSAGAIAQQIIAQGLATDIANSIVASSLANNIGAASPVPPTAGAIGSSVGTNVATSGAPPIDSPNVLYNATVSGTGAFAPQLPSIDITKYNSVDIYIDETDLGGTDTSGYRHVTLMYYVGVPGNYTLVNTLDINYQPDYNGSGAVITVPAVGTSLVITYGAASSATIKSNTQNITTTVIGSYRHVPKAIYNSYVSVPADAARILFSGTNFVTWRQDSFTASQSFTDFLPTKAGRATLGITINGATPTAGLDAQITVAGIGGAVIGGLSAFKSTSPYTYYQELTLPMAPITLFARNRDAAVWNSGGFVITLSFDS